MSSSIIEAVSLIPKSHHVYQSHNFPDYHGGNNPRIGFGGWSIAFSINAAAQTLDSKSYSVYSVLGIFLNFANTGLKVFARVTAIRDTKTFVTRTVDLFQTSNEKERKVMVVTVDFHRVEPASVLSYSTPPSRSYDTPDRSATSDDQIKTAREQGINEEVIKDFQHRFRCLHSKFERRVAPGTIFDQDLSMMAQKSTDLLEPHDITERRNAEYFRSRSSLGCHLDNVLALAFLLDSGMPFTPPIFAGRAYSDIGIAGSIDFALRIFTNDLNLNRWVLKEEKTSVANAGRTYIEATMFDHQGTMIANMTEQCILRPPMKRNAKM